MRDSRASVWRDGADVPRRGLNQAMELKGAAPSSPTGRSPQYNQELSTPNRVFRWNRPPRQTRRKPTSSACLLRANPPAAMLLVRANTWVYCRGQCLQTVLLSESPLPPSRAPPPPPTGTQRANPPTRLVRLTPSVRFLCAPSATPTPRSSSGTIASPVTVGRRPGTRRCPGRVNAGLAGPRRVIPGEVQHDKTAKKFVCAAGSDPKVLDGPDIPNQTQSWRCRCRKIVFRLQFCSTNLRCPHLRVLKTVRYWWRSQFRHETPCPGPRQGPAPKGVLELVLLPQTRQKWPRSE